MMNSITRSLNIVAIWTKSKNRKKRIVSIKLYIQLIHARSHFKSKVFTVFTLKTASCMYKPNT